MRSQKHRDICLPWPGGQASSERELMSAGGACISVSFYLLSLLLIITAVPSHGRSHTKAAGLCSTSQRNYHSAHRGNGARQGQGLCSISLLIPVHLSFSSTIYPLPLRLPTYTVADEFHSRANLYFQDNQRLDTHSFPILQSGRLNGNWRLNFWNETQESF